MTESFHLKRHKPLIQTCKNALKAKKQRGNKAFSLVEMLMALVVASLLLAALAPVITKKIGEEKISFEGQVANPTRKKIVYLTEPGNGEWEVPNGIRHYKVTTVGAGGGGGAGSNYGCVVFTTTATPLNSLNDIDSEYCSHVRGDGNINFAIPDGVEEIYVSLISGAGGGGGGGASWADPVVWDTKGTYTWNVPEILRGDRVLVTMNGGGGGGGGADQGGGGGGASGGYVKPTAYDIATNKTSIPVVVGGGGGGGQYFNKAGAGGSGKPAGENGKEIKMNLNGATHNSYINGGGGGGASNFDNGSITAFGGGGGAGTFWASGWLTIGNCISVDNLHRTVFNYGGNGTAGGTSGPYGNYGGASGGNGGAGGGVSTGGNGGNGISEINGVKATGSARGGIGGAKGASGTGKGGYAQDQAASFGGGAGGGGGGSFFAAGTNAITNCNELTNSGSSTSIAKAGTGAGGAGGSCGYNIGGALKGGDGGDGIVKINYLKMSYGGTGGQAGAVVPRSRIALTSTMKYGSNLTINLGRGGKGGDRVIAYPNGNNVEIRTMDSAGNINSTTNLDNAKGRYGSASSIMFNSTTIATTGSGSCGGGYQTSTDFVLNCQAPSCGTKFLDGSCNSNGVGGWHGDQHLSCTSINGLDRHRGSTTFGGASTNLNWNGTTICGIEGGTSSSRNGKDGGTGHGGSGAYYGGYGGKGGDGYVKIEWGLARNIDRSEAARYAGGGGGAGEYVTKTINVSPIVRKIKYTIGAGGSGGSFNSNTLKMMDGADGGATTFGNGNTYGFNAVSAKGGKGGKSVKITSSYDSYFRITELTGANGNGGISCTDETKCSILMNGKAGSDTTGGAGGKSATGNGANGGNVQNINGFDAVDFNGTAGGGAGGGGGISAEGNYGRGGKGSNGYIIIEYED